MYYICIDIAKFDHCASVVDSQGEVLVEPFYFENNNEGLQVFLSKTQEYSRYRHVTGLEATGHYGDNFISFLLDNDYQVGIINPISTNAQRKLKIRKTKNDKKDTFLIAQVLMAKEYTTMTKQKFKMREAKQLTRYHSEITETIATYKNRLQKNIDMVFPEYNTFFKTKYSKIYMAVLKEFGSAYNIANAHLTKLKTVLCQKGKGQSTVYDPIALRDLAKKSIGNSNPILALEMQQLIASIELFTEQLAQVDKKIEELAQSSNSPIFSIPGIGIITGMSILSEIGDIDLFGNSSKIIGFAGMDPAVYQSGEYQALKTAISKRGSTYLRKSLYQCILSVCNYNPVFQDYYTKKRNEGKVHRCAQGHCIRKLLRVIYKLLTEDIVFNEGRLH